MAEEKVFKGALSLEVHDSIIYVTEESGRVLHYLDPDNWETEVKLTRKVKPIPNGTVVTQSGMLYGKHNGKWIYHGTGGVYVGARANHQDDEHYRHFTRLVEGSWD